MSVLGSPGVAAASTRSPRSAKPQDDTSSYVYLAGDHHIHTQFSSDAMYRPHDQAFQAAKYGLDWIVITDHGSIGHAKFGVELVNPDIRSARAAIKNLLVFQGLEWNIPAAEHATIIVTPGDNEVSVLKAFENDYDGVVKGATVGAPGAGSGCPAAARSMALTAAAATAEPPFSDTLVTERSPLARSASLASAAPTKPTGSPTTNAGSTFLVRISASAVGAQPTTQTAPGPTSPNASRTAAAAPGDARGPGQPRAQRLPDLAHHRPAGDPGRDHLGVGHHGGAAGQRRHPGGQRFLVADQVGRVVEVGAGVDDPLGHVPAEPGQPGQVDPGPQDPVRLSLDRVHPAGLAGPAGHRFLWPGHLVSTSWAR